MSDYGNTQLCSIPLIFPWRWWGSSKPCIFFFIYLSVTKPLSRRFEIFSLLKSSRKVPRRLEDRRTAVSEWRAMFKYPEVKFHYHGWKYKMYLKHDVSCGTCRCWQLCTCTIHHSEPERSAIISCRLKMKYRNTKVRKPQADKSIWITVRRLAVYKE